MTVIDGLIAVVFVLTIIATARAIKLDQREREALTAKEAKDIVKQKVSNYKSRRNGKGLFKPKKGR